ncbi:hypothetical protein U1Q18_051678, partial [Sarracenia purpurea var. burkii]
MKYVFALSLIAFVVFTFNTEVRAEEDDDSNSSTTLNPDQRNAIQDFLNKISGGNS